MSLRIMIHYFVMILLCLTSSGSTTGKHADKERMSSAPKAANEKPPLKILIFIPGHSNSHLLFNYRLAQTLANQGHEVVIWTTLDWPLNNTNLKPPPNVVEHRVLMDFPSRNVSGHMSVFDEKAFEDMGVKDTVQMFRNLRSIFREACAIQLEQEDLLDELRDKKFDVVLTHFFGYCTLALAHVMGYSDKVVWVAPGTFILETTAYNFGLHTMPSYIPNSMGFNSDRMTFKQRIVNALWYSVNVFLGPNIPSLTTDEDDLFREVPHNNRPDLVSLSHRVSGLMVNGEGVLDFPRPLPFVVSYLGELGEGGGGVRPLEGTFKDIVDRTEKGVVLFSLGTIAKAKHMPLQMKVSLMRAFEMLGEEGYDVIWKFDQDIEELKENPRVHVLKWIPQRDLLSNSTYFVSIELDEERVKLFITHGGYNSLLEATKSGTPLVLIPLFADQFCNAARAERQGLGVVLDKMAITPTALTSAALTVLTDPQYSNRAKQLSRTLKDKMVDGGQMLGHRIHLLARKRHLLPTLHRGKRLGFLRYHCLDVLALVCTLSIASLYLLLRFILRISQWMESTNKTNK